MINLSGSKENLGVSLSTEHEFLVNYDKFQERLNNNIYMLLRQCINSKIISSLEESKELYKKLSNITKCLNLSNQCRKSIRWFTKRIRCCWFTISWIYVPN